MPTPFDAHADTLADYLGWLTFGISATDDLSSIVAPVFTWQSNEYTCNFSLLQQRDLREGGYTPVDDLVIEVLQPMPEPGPMSEQLITFKGKDYRIRTVKTAAGKYPQLVCYDPARGT